MTRILTPTPTIGDAPSHSAPDMTYAPGLGLARFLGWFSIALGAAETFAPEVMRDITGIRSKRLLQLYGLREIATGVAILTSENPAPWVWGRVAGDALDLATLGDAYIEGGDRERKSACISMIAVAGVTALDAICASELTVAAQLQG